MARFHVACRTFAAVAFLLFVAPVPHTTSAELDQTSAESIVRSGTQAGSSSSYTPEACRECGGLPYYPPSAAQSEAAREAASEKNQPNAKAALPDFPSDVAAPSEAPPKDPPDAASSAGPTVEFGRPHLSSDRRVNMARALVQRNRFAEALKILKPLALEDRPDLTDVRFLLGLAASRGAQEPDVGDERRGKLLDLAIAAFRSILIKQPELVRVRLELALTFYLKQEDALAREHFERALVGKPPAALIANINRFLTIMRARRRWTGYFGFSLAPDTNINAASDAQVFYLNNLPFRPGPGQQTSSGIGVVSWGGGEYQFPLADRWRLRAGLNVNHREYKGNRFDQTFLGGFVGPRWLVSRNTEMSLLASASQRWWGGSPFNYDIGARLEVEHRVFAGLRLNGRASWQDRTNQQQKFLEGPLMVFSLGVNYVLFPTVQVNGLVGYQQQDAQLRFWNSGGYWTQVGTNVALPWGFTIGASAEFRWTNFEGASPYVRDFFPREDQTRILQATLLNRAITVYGFSPQVAFSNQVRESNADLFDYKRNLVEMRWVRQF